MDARGAPRWVLGDHPEDVKAAQHRPRVATLQHSELLSEREVLQDEMPTAMKHASERSDPEKEHVEHGPELFVAEHCSTLLILRSVRVLANQQGEFHA